MLFPVFRVYSFIRILTNPMAPCQSSIHPGRILDGETCFTQSFPKKKLELRFMNFNKDGVTGRFVDLKVVFFVLSFLPLRSTNSGSNCYSYSNTHSYVVRGGSNCYSYGHSYNHPFPHEFLFCAVFVLSHTSLVDNGWDLLQMVP